MSLKSWSIGAAAAAALLLAGAAAQAAPAGLAAPGLKVAAHRSSPIEPVNYRRCWWRFGYRHCHWYPGYPGYAYYGALPFVGFSVFGGRHYGYGFGGWRGRHWR